MLQTNLEAVPPKVLILYYIFGVRNIYDEGVISLFQTGENAFLAYEGLKMKRIFHFKSWNWILSLQIW